MLLQETKENLTNYVNEIMMKGMTLEGSNDKKV
jgi:hypothetical protein